MILTLIGMEYKSITIFFILTMDLFTMHNVQGVACCDKPSASYLSYGGFWCHLAHCFGFMTHHFTASEK